VSRLVLDPLTEVSTWSALAPDGVTPSAELSISVDSSHPRPGAAATSAQISATEAALNHVLRRPFAPAIDLTASDELRLACFSTRLADGTPANPFFLEMRLASAAVGLDAPANTWSRNLPVAQKGVWDVTRLNLADLPPAIRGGVTVMQLRCIHALPPFKFNIEDLLAVRDEMIGDIDATLRVRLDSILSLNGAPVPALLHPANGAITQARPYFEITNYDIVYARERTQSTRPRSDFSDTGYWLRPPSNAYDVYYQITAVADDRRTQSQMLEFVLSSLPPRGEILVNDFPLQMDIVEVDPLDQLGGFRTDRLPLFYRIQSRQEVGTSTRVAGAKTVVVDGDIG
jgi:hypothetical protein